MILAIDDGNYESIVDKNIHGDIIHTTKIKDGLLMVITEDCSVWLFTQTLNGIREYNKSLNNLKDGGIKHVKK